MAFGYEFTCNKCGQVDRAQFRPRSYLCPDRTILNLYCELAWCDGCGHVVAAETLPDIAFLESRLAHWSGLNADDKAVGKEARILRCESESLLAYRRYVVTRQIEWRRGRSKPRCLECGSEAITRTAPDPNAPPPDVPHPHCGGQLVQTGFVRFSPATHDLFTPDGFLADRSSDVSVAMEVAQAIRIFSAPPSS